MRADHQDIDTLPELILEIKKALRVLPKVDVLSPFRVHFVSYGSYCLNIQVRWAPTRDGGAQIGD
jgi:hypothetical protein